MKQAAAGAEQGTSAVDHADSPVVAAAQPLVTDRVALAAFLVARGHKPTLERSASGFVRFAFASSPEVTREVESFYDGTATVQPALYDSARVELRRQMDALKGGAR